MVGKSNASMSIAAALSSLIFAFAILFVMSFVGNGPVTRKRL